MTGSLNQTGEVQAIGGANHKIEGFFRACMEAGSLTGKQGAIVPASNADQLLLEPEVTAAIAAGTFHIWTVEHLDDALEILLDMPVGAANAQGACPKDTIFGRVQSTLRMFNEELIRAERPIG